MSTRATSDSQGFPLAPTNRRKFLAAAGSVAAFSIVSPALVAGADANTKVKAGVVGLGGRGGWIANYVARHGGFQITAVADYFEEVVQSTGERLEVPPDHRFSGLSAYQRLLDSKVEAVFLETPPFFFPAHARAAAAAGCHIYLAKPVAVDVPGCLEILALGRQAGTNRRVFLVDFQTRTDPLHIAAIEKVREGMIGELGLITSFYHDDCFPDPPRGKTIENLLRRLRWCNHTALGGGYLVNAGIHAVDVGLWIAGAVPRRATGHALRRRANAQGDTHDCYAVSFEFPTGTIMAHTGEHMPNHSKFRAGCIAHGQLGYLEANYAGKVFVRGPEETWNGGESPHLYADGMQSNVSAFHKSIVEGNFANPTLEPAVNATLATILGREAGRHGRTIRWEELLQATERLAVDLTGLRV